MNRLEEIIEDSTKTVEMVIDVIWVINIFLKFITPYDSGVGPEDHFD